MVSLRKKHRSRRSDTWNPFSAGGGSGVLPRFHLPKHGDSQVDSILDEQPLDFGEFHITAAATSLQGTQRQVNQDRCSVNLDQRLFIVADGMGGYSGGQLASRYIVQRLPELLGSLDEQHNVFGAMFDAMEQVHKDLNAFARRNGLLSDMGASVAMLLIAGDQAYIAHAGNCRVYLSRGDGIQRLTVDQTLVEQLMQTGLINSREALQHPLRYYVTNSLGVEPFRNSPSFHCERVQSGDRFILVTDGVVKVLSDLELRQQVLQASSPQELTRQIIRESVTQNATDDTSCVAVFINEGDDA